MLKLAFSQLKFQRGRYTAMVLAIVVGIAFLSAALAGVSSTRATLNASVGAAVQGSDIVIQPNGFDQENPLTADVAERIEGLEGVESTHLVRIASGSMSAENGTQRSVLVQSMPENLDQFPTQVVTGTFPDASDEVLLDQNSADSYDIQIGQRIDVELFGNTGSADYTVTVTGFVQPLQVPAMMGSIQLFGSEKLVVSANDSLAAQQLLVRAPGANLNDLVTQVSSVAGNDGDVTIMTVDEYVEDSSTAGGDIMPITVILLVFAFIAMAVMMLVINNTFSVIVAQRTREIGLLRVVGSTKNQLFRMVLGEAALIGLFASILGVAVGLGLLALALAVAASIWNIDFITFTAGLTDILIPVALGILATVAAAWRPARQATRVSPVQALAPELLEENSGRVTVGKTVLGFLILLIGSAVLLYFVFGPQNLFLAMLGGLISFIGILLLTPLFVPPLVKLVGLLTKPLGVTGQQARLNAARHPQRTATTAAALLIGTTLIMMMVTGAETVKREMDKTLNEYMPVDITIPLYNLQDSDTIKEDFDEALASATPLIRDHVGPTAITYQLTGPEFFTEDLTETTVQVADLNELAAASRVEGKLPAPGEVALFTDTERETVEIGGKELKVIENPYGWTISTLANPQDFPDAEKTPQTYIISLEKDIPAADVEEFRDELATTLGVEPFEVQGSVFERTMLNQIINTVLSVVNAMLAVALLIAFIGVANTLTLSTIERQRENGLLRAIGLTKSGLRQMLVLEAVLISVVAVVIGSVLGIVYGWLGSRAVLMGLAVTPHIPWVSLAIVVIAAVACAIIAAAVPARRALKLSPVQALTE